MNRILARRALLHTGWADNVLLGIRDGEIAEVSKGVPAPPATDVTAGIVIPGLTNAHSHAFQRALAGRTEHRAGAGRDSFWTWRERMYELTGRLDAGSLTAVARQAYTEMLASGYTSVVEFHYLFRDDTGGGDGDAMFEALRRAAADSGIRLIYLPVLYERAGFDRPAPEARQRRFAMDVESFLAHQERAADAASGRVTVGIGAHSLRAVSDASLRRVAARAAASGCPCTSTSRSSAGRSRTASPPAAPARCAGCWTVSTWTRRGAWSTRPTSTTRRPAISPPPDAVVCLCPSTEGNLGDGLFPLERFLRAGGRIAIGSDSQATINPFEELRWLEYGQRLVSETRNVASVEDPHVGQELFRRALAGGAQAAGASRFGLVPGAPADLVVLDAEDPMLAGHGPATLLDALLFSGYRVPIERVMVHGEWKVVGGRHVDRTRTARDFAAALARLGVESP